MKFLLFSGVMDLKNVEKRTVTFFSFFVRTYEYFLSYGKFFFIVQSSDSKICCKYTFGQEIVPQLCLILFKCLCLRFKACIQAVKLYKNVIAFKVFQVQEKNVIKTRIRLQLFCLQILCLGRYKFRSSYKNNLLFF